MTRHGLHALRMQGHVWSGENVRSALLHTIESRCIDQDSLMERILGAIESGLWLDNGSPQEVPMSRHDTITANS
jgi:hypothetical protein